MWGFEWVSRDIGRKDIKNDALDTMRRVLFKDERLIIGVKGCLEINDYKQTFDLATRRTWGSLLRVVLQATSRNRIQI